jgi:hypothetical protein
MLLGWTAADAVRADPAMQSLPRDLRVTDDEFDRLEKEQWRDDLVLLVLMVLAELAITVVGVVGHWFP